MNKHIFTIGIIVLALAALGVGVYTQKNTKTKNTSQNLEVKNQEDTKKAPQDVKNTPAMSDEQKLETKEMPQGATQVASATYTISPSSKVEWEGKKTLLANYVDTGSLMVKEGKAVVKDGVITSGEVVFDMNSINALATAKQTGQDMLSNHLKSDAFFDVATYPIATFVLKEASSMKNENEPFLYTLKGDLTIKGITNQVTMPARVYSKEGSVFVDALATLDRTKWNIRFGSSKFFDNLADNVIDDYFTVNFLLHAYQTEGVSQEFNKDLVPQELPPTPLLPPTVMPK